MITPFKYEGLVDGEAEQFVEKLHKLSRQQLAEVAAYCIQLMAKPRHTVIQDDHWMLKNQPPNATASATGQECGVSDVTDGVVNAVENEVGMGCGAWDCVPPKQIIAAAWKFVPKRHGPATDVLNTTCQQCCEPCDTWEEVESGYGDRSVEIWCWCRKCRMQTFHPKPPNATASVTEGRP